MEKAEQLGQAPGSAPVTAALPLTFARLTDDGTHLVLLDGDRSEHLVEVTPRLRAALRGSATPRSTGQVEIKMDSTLRPRDIQARIRAGETPESVAEAARTTVEKIQPFVAPVLAEREHVAERAQKANVRRPAGEPGSGARSLGDAVEAHLRSCNIDPTITSWDSWRREDGRWTLTGSFEAPLRSGTARFTFDLPGNYVVLDNDDARWLVGDVIATPPSRDDLQSVRERRLTAVLEDELPLGDDALDLVAEPVAEPVAQRVAETEAEPGDVPLPDVVVEEVVVTETVETVEVVVEEPVAEEAPAPEPETPPRRPVAKKKGRASVPSWDEIMFGPGDGQ